MTEFVESTRDKHRLVFTVANKIACMIPESCELVKKSNVCTEDEPCAYDYTHIAPRGLDATLPFSQHSMLYFHNAPYGEDRKLVGVIHVAGIDTIKNPDKWLQEETPCLDNAYAA